MINAIIMHHRNLFIYCLLSLVIWGINFFGFQFRGSSLMNERFRFLVTQLRGWCVGGLYLGFWWLNCMVDVWDGCRRCEGACLCSVCRKAVLHILSYLYDTDMNLYMFWYDNIAFSQSKNLSWIDHPMQMKMNCHLQKSAYVHEFSSPVQGMVQHMRPTAPLWPNRSVSSSNASERHVSPNLTLIQV